MAKRRRNANFEQVPVSRNGSLATLADGAVDVTLIQASAFGRSSRIHSVDLLWTLRGLTAGEGPLLFGVAHSDYTAAEIVEALAATIVDGSDKIALEQARRLVRRIGIFSGFDTNETFNDGKSMKTRLNWEIQDGKSLNIWVLNNSGAILTTGSAVQVNGHINLTWT